MIELQVTEYRFGYPIFQIFPKFPELKIVVTFRVAKRSASAHSTRHRRSSGEIVSTGRCAVRGWPARARLPRRRRDEAGVRAERTRPSPGKLSRHPRAPTALIRADAPLPDAPSPSVASFAPARAAPPARVGDPARVYTAPPRGAVPAATPAPAPAPRLRHRGNLRNVTRRPRPKQTRIRARVQRASIRSGRVGGAPPTPPPRSAVSARRAACGVGRAEPARTARG